MNAKQVAVLEAVGVKLNELVAYERPRVVAALIVGFSLEKEIVSILANNAEMTRLTMRRGKPASKSTKKGSKP